MLILVLTDNVVCVIKIKGEKKGMNIITEKYGVRSTTTFEVINQKEFEKKLKELLKELDGVDEDWLDVIHTVEQAKKQDKVIEQDLCNSNENEFSTIAIWIEKLASEQLVEEFESGKRKSDYEKYTVQQEGKKVDRAHWGEGDGTADCYSVSCKKCGHELMFYHADINLEIACPRCRTWQPTGQED